MKNILSCCAALLLNASLFSQVQIDKPIDLTGGTNERSITNLEAPVNGTDAVNKDYVDSAVAASGGSCHPAEVTNELTGSVSSPVPCSGTGCGSNYSPRDCSIACDNLIYNDNSDWRIPSLEELWMLINIASGNTS